VRGDDVGGFAEIICGFVSVYCAQWNADARGKPPIGAGLRSTDSAKTACFIRQGTAKRAEHAKSADLPWDFEIIRFISNQS
jgi:hypothetical protein